MAIGLARSNPLFYRRSLVPGRLKEFSCEITAPPVKPSPVKEVSIVNPSFTVEGNANVYSFTVTWFPPEFSNGELKEYEIRLLDPSMPEDISSVQPQSVMVRAKNQKFLDTDQGMWHPECSKCATRGLKA